MVAGDSMGHAVGEVVVLPAVKDGRLGGREGVCPVKVIHFFVLPERTGGQRSRRGQELSERES